MQMHSGVDFLGQIRISPHLQDISASHWRCLPCPVLRVAVWMVGKVAVDGDHALLAVQEEDIQVKVCATHTKDAASSAGIDKKHALGGTKSFRPDLGQSMVPLGGSLGYKNLNGLSCG